MFGLDLGNLLVHLRADTSQYKTALRNAQHQMQATGKKLEQIGKKMSMYVTAPLAGLGYLAVKEFATFDDAMTKSLAIMGDVSRSQREAMEAEAIRISDKSVTSADELAKSYYYLASAGLDVEQSTAALSQVEQFAVAGAFDMAEATDLLTDAQSALGLTVDDATENMKNMKRMSDILVGANTLANASVQQFSQALTSEAGAAMKSLNIELEQGVAMLAAYADQGIKAQHAGSMFGRMLRMSTKIYKDNSEAWEALGVSLYDAEGELTDMHKFIGQLTNALEDMSTQEKIAALEMLGFQAESQQAILPLLGLSDQIRNYTQELKNMEGITKDVYDKQLKSFTAQIKILWNNIKNLGKEIAKQLVPTIRSLSKVISTIVEWFRGMSDEGKKLAVQLAAMTAAFGPATYASGKLIGVFATLTTKANATSAAIIGVSTAIKGLSLFAAGYAGKYLFEKSAEENGWLANLAYGAGATALKDWEYFKYGAKQTWTGMKEGLEIEGAEEERKKNEEILKRNLEGIDKAYTKLVNPDTYFFERPDNPLKKMNEDAQNAKNSIDDAKQTLEDFLPTELKKEPDIFDTIGLNGESFGFVGRALAGVKNDVLEIVGLKDDLWDVLGVTEEKGHSILAGIDNDMIQSLGGKSMSIRTRFMDPSAIGRNKVETLLNQQLSETRKQTGLQKQIAERDSLG